MTQDLDECKLLALPTEILIHISCFVMWTDVPLYLENILELKLEDRKKHQPHHDQRVPSKWKPFPLNLHESQRQHVADWKVATGICRQLRELGQRIFFSERPLIMSVACLKAFQGGFEAQDGSVKAVPFAKTCNTSLKALIFANTRQVIVPLMGGSEVSQAIQVPVFNAFQNLNNLALRLETLTDTELLLDIEYNQGRTYQRQYPMMHSGPPKSYTAPTELRTLLQQLDFDTKGIKLTLLVADWGRGPQAAQDIIDKWERAVYPLLAFKGRNKQRIATKIDSAF